MAFPGSIISSAFVLDNQATQARIEWASPTNVALKPFQGQWIVVNRQLWQATQFADLTSTSNEMAGDGTSLGTPLPTDQLLYVYACSQLTDFNMTLAASGVAPTQVGTDFYLGTTGEAAYARFVGCVYMLSGAFVDQLDARLVWNQWNRVQKAVYTCPEYLNDGSDTLWTCDVSGFNPANHGTGDSVQFLTGPTAGILTGDTSLLSITVTTASAAPGAARFGITLNGSGDVECACGIANAAPIGTSATCTKAFSSQSLWAHEQAYFLADTGGLNLDLFADFAAGGIAGSDLAATFLSGTVWT